MNILIKIKRVINKFRRLDWVIEHAVNVFLGRPDKKWDFYHFDKKVHKKTWEKHDEILKWANYRINNAEKFEELELYEKSNEPVVKQGYYLMEKIKEEFKNKYSDADLRILIHIPPPMISPAGFSLFSNLLQGLCFISIKAEPLNWDQPIEDNLRSFKPNFFITSDDEPYLNRINWEAVANYRRHNELKLGLTASLEEHGNTPLVGRLKWSKAKKVDFYYSFEDQEYIRQRKEYHPFFEEGYQIISIPFGVNPLVYYPIPDIKKDLNYVFIGSKTMDKFTRFSYWEGILAKTPGFISGTGWSVAGPNFRFNQEQNRYIFARAKVGLNLHLDLQVEWACELNERAYALAACGVPQLIDNPKILYKKFSKGCFFVGESPEEYEQLFYCILDNPKEAQNRALEAQKEVFSKHTIFHRAEDFVKALELLG